MLSQADLANLRRSSAATTSTSHSTTQPLPRVRAPQRSPRRALLRPSVSLVRAQLKDSEQRLPDPPLSPPTTNNTSTLQQPFEGSSSAVTSGEAAESNVLPLPEGMSSGAFRYDQSITASMDYDFLWNRNPNCKFGECGVVVWCVWGERGRESQGRERSGPRALGPHSHVRVRLCGPEHTLTLHKRAHMCTHEREHTHAPVSEQLRSECTKPNTRTHAISATLPLKHTHTLLTQAESRRSCARTTGACSPAPPVTRSRASCLS